MEDPTLKSCLAFVVALLLGYTLAKSFPAQAGEDPLGSGCRVNSADGGAATSLADTDCSWISGDWLSLQCAAEVRYTKNGNWPTSDSPLVAPGDPYPIQAKDSSSQKPIKVVLPDGGPPSCIIFKNDVH